ncbi:E3 ubiquitin-protein ligase sis3 [Thalictrum thalictroides]|uniref:E3 ubiquitin-protein ligase sis3 n=1 Tax=Thalictrum thalictroides TaxID=46969 RepID=A0A7J6WP03_THATH|nr:E3 ubiquitin-protein ligase sis3 [Thalictrum thalictroides]
MTVLSWFNFIAQSSPSVFDLHRTVSSSTLTASSSPSSLSLSVFQDVAKYKYDGFFLSMLATSVIIVAINWKRYHLCTHPLHMWIVADYTTVFVFRLLMFVDNGLAAGMGL